MWKTLAIVVGWIVLAFILIQVAMHLIGMFMMFAMLLGAAVLIGAPIFFYIKYRNQSPDQSVQEVETKLYEPNGSIKLFSKEPTTPQIVMIGVEVANAPKFIEIPNDTVIKIVHDEDKQAVKVKIVTGAQKGKTGWVSRGAIIKSAKGK